LNNKLFELESLAHINKYDLIFITETWFNDSSISSLFGYTTYRKDRKQKSQGGGVCIFVSDRLLSSEIHDKVLNDTSIEQVWCTIQIHEETILIGCVYRPHVKDDVKLLSKSIYQSKKWHDENKCSGILLAGDFNFPGIIWDDEYYCGKFDLEKPLSNEENFIDSINDCFLAQHVSFPTFIMEDGTSKNTLDLIFTENKSRIYNIESLPPLVELSRSHIGLSWKYFVARSSSNLTNYCSSNYKYTKGNYDLINKFFSSMDWNELFKDKDIEQMFNIFISTYKKACDTYIPLKGPRRTGKLRWLSQDLKQAIKLKTKLWYKTKFNKNDIDSQCQYKKICHNVKKLVKRDTIAYEKKLISDSKEHPKILYSYINQKTTCKESIKALRSGDQILKDPQDIVEILNEHFKSVFTVHENQVLPQFPKRTEQICDIDLKSFDYEAVSKKLKELNGDKTPGLDSVHPIVLKQCALSLAFPLSLLFKKSFSSSQLPSSWKRANITALFKKGSRLDVSNYRPVSLTSIVCKIMESIIKEHLMKHLLQNDLISIHQHGFMSQKSCTTNLLESMDFITGNNSRGIPVDVLYTDFAKAFDKVSHLYLIHKLRSYGIGNKIISWLFNYLNGRQQRVVIGKSESMWCDVLSGVPQGSVLGPILFLIHINDLADHMRNPIKLFADDSKVLCALINDQSYQHLQIDINSIVTWTKKWNMLLNCGKCKIMHFGKKNPNHSYTIEDYNSGIIEPLSTSEMERDLGLIITNNLKWQNQVQSARNMANRKLGILNHTFKCKESELYKQLYVAYVRPLLEFAVPVWNPYLKSDIRTLEKVQRRATRLPNEHRGLSYEERRKNWKIQSLEERRKRGDLIQFFKFNNDMDKINWFNPPKQARSLSLSGPAASIRGHQQRYTRELTKNASRQTFFTNRIIKQWNNLDQKCTTAINTNQFKAKIEKFIKY
jgi:hypothetical protein